MKFARHKMLASLSAALFLVAACGNKEDVATGAAPAPAAARGTMPGAAPAIAASRAMPSVASAVSLAAAATVTAAGVPAATQAAASATSPTAAPSATAAAMTAEGPKADAPALPTDAQIQPETPATAARAGEGLKVGFAYAGAVGDGGRAYAHDRGRKAMETALGGKVTTSYVESVPEGAAAESVLRNLVSQGNRVIFGTSPAHMEVMARLAQEFPEIKWEVAGSSKSADNLRTYDVRAYEAAYLAGIIAGKMTRTDTLGFVAATPVPQVVRNINAFTLGAQSVNPSVRTKVIWVNKWLDPGRESEAAQALIKGGADVLLQNTDSSAPLQVAEKAGKYAFGWNSDMKAPGSKSHLGSAIIDLAPYYTKTVEQVLAGRWKAEPMRLGIKEGAVDLVSVSDAVAEDVKALVAEKRKAIADGSFRIWKGPMLTSEDEEILATGAVGDEKFIGSMMFYVKGVEGKVPTGN